MTQITDRHQNEGQNVNIRWLDIEDVEANQWADLERLIDPTERARATRFHFDRDRKMYIAGHALMRAMLSAQIPRQPAEWRFTTNAQGKPEAIISPDQPRLRANLSHTQGMVAVALTVDHDVGIDVEWRLRRGLSMEIVDHFFAPAEVAALKALPSDQLNEALFAYWTLKEALIKAVGLGLSMPLDSFAFTLEPLSVEFSENRGDPGSWLFRRFQPAPDYAMALALRHPNPDTVRVSILKVETLEILEGSL